MRVIVFVGLIFSNVPHSVSGLKLLYGRAIPLNNRRLNVSQKIIFNNVTTTIQCALLCGNVDCKAFNYGKSSCEVLGTYLCDMTIGHSLVSSDGYRYYDVEYNENELDLYYDTEDCVDHGRCSPKCYKSTNTITDITTSLFSITATTPAPQPANTPTTTIGNTLPINNPCVSSADCTVTNSECRINICQCQAGYSLRIFSNTVRCVSACDTGYSMDNNGEGFTETRGHYLDDKFQSPTVASSTECKQACLDSPINCLSTSYFSDSNLCYISGNTKLVVPAPSWKTSNTASYFQRNCKKM